MPNNFLFQKINRQNILKKSWKEFLMNCSPSKSIVIWSLYNIKNMSERKSWLEQEDRILKALVEERNLNKWALIARIMAEEFGIPGRTGKQCRERYHNHLDNRIKHSPWSRQEQELLVALQANMGNHWAQISRAIAGRSQNCVKNRFYSIMRRGVKMINLAIRRQLKKYKELSVNAVNKIIQLSEPVFNNKSLSRDVADSNQIKKEVLRLGLRDDVFPISREEYAEIKVLIDKIKFFRKNPGCNKIQNKTQEEGEKYLHSQEVSEKNQEEQIGEDKQNQGEKPNQNNEVIWQKKISLQSLGEHGEEFLPAEEIKSYGFAPIFEPIVSKNMSIFSSLSNQKKSSSNELFQHELLRKDSTIKSFEFPEHDHVRSPFVMLQSPHFEQLRNLSSWSYLFHH